VTYCGMHCMIEECALDVCMHTDTYIHLKQRYVKEF